MRPAAFVLFVATALAVVSTTSTAQDQRQRQSPKLEAALFAPVRLEFVETPLSDVAEYLQDLGGVTVVLDARGLAKAELTGRVPITFRQQAEVPMHAALDQMLRPLGLGWVIEGEAMMLTTATVAATRLSSRSYYVADLAWWGGSAELARLIVKSIEPQTWSSVGGNATMRITGTQLVVTQTQAGHRQIMTLLRDLRRRRSD